MSRQHPLQNALILKTLFQYASLEDICKYRLVCHEWNDIGKMLLIKKKKKIKFTDLAHMQKFVEDMRNTNDVVPFSRFDMDDINVTPIVEEFFQTVQNVTELTIQFSGDTDVETSVTFEILRDILRLTCNTLEVLEINCMAISFLRSKRLYPNGKGLIPSQLTKLTNLKLFLLCPECPGKLEFFTSLFKAAPMLTDISCCCFRSAGSVLKAIALKKNIPLIKNLIILSNEVADAKALLILCRSHELRLTTLKLVLSYTIEKFPIDGKVIAELLSTQKDCLKYFRTSEFTWQGIDFPVMSNLKTLSVTGQVNIRTEFFLRQLRYITPNLEKLDFPIYICLQVIKAAVELWNYLDRSAIAPRVTDADPLYPAIANTLCDLPKRGVIPRST